MLAKIDFFYNFFGNILQSGVKLEGRDFFDILIIAFLIYVGIKLIRETHSIPAAIGVLTLLGFYGVALLFDLPLTSLVFRSFFGFFLIIIAIIFQRELRRFFSAFGFLGFARRFTPPADTIIEIISHVVGRLAQEKTGLLLVFPGREPIERQLEGGYRLNGEISEPLLLSIFDKTSPGHDGAAIVQNNKIKKFASHLPLADQIEKVKHFGLRHRAALGLAEHSDALIVVVSEERGVISIARNGNLTQLKNEDELKQKLGEFYAEKFPSLSFINLLQWIAKNAILLVFSFTIAFGLFLITNSRFVLVQRNFVVVPEFKNIPGEIIIGDIMPQEVVLTLQGRSADFDTLKSENIRIAVDVGNIKNIIKPGWHRFFIDEKEVELPFKLSVIKIDPSSVDIQIAKRN